MNTLTDRTPELIAAEINNIKSQTRKMVLYNSIEIGRRLVEVKEMLNHGEWGKWLEKSVEYSQSTANNLMRIFEEYGSSQITLLEDNAKSQTLGNLSYSQAVALLGIPEDERESFVQENDVENMSSRELQKVIKEKKDLEKKLKDAEKRCEKESKDKQTILDNLDKLTELNKSNQEKVEKFKVELSKTLNENEKYRQEIEKVKKSLSKAKASGDEDEINKLQNLLSDREKELEVSNVRIQELEQQLNDKPVDVTEITVTKVPEEIEKELEELREKVSKNNNQAMIKFQVYFEELVKNFKGLLESLDEIKETDVEAYSKYGGAVSTLINKMSEKL